MTTNRKPLLALLVVSLLTHLTFLKTRYVIHTTSFFPFFCGMEHVEVLLLPLPPCPDRILVHHILSLFITNPGIMSCPNSSFFSSKAVSVLSLAGSFKASKHQIES